MNTEPDSQPADSTNDDTIKLVPDPPDENQTGADPVNVNESNVLSPAERLADAENQVLLAQADLENFRKRSRREMQEQLRYASLPLMADLLEAADNLQRAIDVAQNNDANANSDSLLEGVSMVARQIATVLENHGCKKIDAVGKPFDPNHHQAVKMQPSVEFDANLVMQELRTGFQLHDRVIRPSQVFVSTGKLAPNTE